MDRARFNRITKDLTIGVDVLLPSNPRRDALLFLPPMTTSENDGYDTALVDGADTENVGVKLATAANSNKIVIVESASFFITGGTPTVDLEYFLSGAVNCTLQQFTASGFWSGPVIVQPGSQVRWNVVTGGGVGSTSEFTISSQIADFKRRYNIAFGEDPDETTGLQVKWSDGPLLLTVHDLGEVLREEVRVWSDWADTLTVYEVSSVCCRQGGDPNRYNT